jgi:hypothetical protein
LSFHFLNLFPRESLARESDFVRNRYGKVAALKQRSCNIAKFVLIFPKEFSVKAENQGIFRQILWNYSEILRKAVHLPFRACKIASPIGGAHNHH